jgi:hypothetical protein
VSTNASARPNRPNKTQGSEEDKPSTLTVTRGVRERRTRTQNKLQSLTLPVPPHEIGVRLPWTHLRDDLIQLLLDAPGEIAVHLTIAHHGFDTPRRAHAEAGRLEPARVVWQGGWLMPLGRQQNPPLGMRRA